LASYIHCLELAANLKDGKTTTTRFPFYKEIEEYAGIFMCFEPTKRADPERSFKNIVGEMRIWGLE
jgi:hypothetical protein